MRPPITRRSLTGRYATLCGTLLVGILGFTLAGCDRPLAAHPAVGGADAGQPVSTAESAGFQLTELSGSGIGAKGFRLRDTVGMMRTLNDFRGQVLALFFGYTHCPDVCPTAMAALAAAKRQLGEAGQRVQVFFISVDPKRDSPDVLRKYLDAFDPSFIGLLGNKQQINALEDDFKIPRHQEAGHAALAGPTTSARAEVPSEPSGLLQVKGPHVHPDNGDNRKGARNYTVNHGAGVFVFDVQGNIRLFAGNGTDPDTFAHDLHLLLREK